MREGLTPKQAAVLTAVRGYVAQHGFAPTLQELCELLGLRAEATVCKHLQTLARKGYVTRQWNRTRATTVQAPEPHDPVFLAAVREAFAAGWHQSEACAVPRQAGQMDRWRAQWLKETHGYDGNDSGLGPGDRCPHDGA